MENSSENLKKKEYYTGPSLTNWIVLAENSLEENFGLLSDLKTDIENAQEKLANTNDENERAELTKEIRDNEQVISKYQRNNDFIEQELAKLLDHSFLNEKELNEELRQELIFTIEVKKEQIINMQAKLAAREKKTSSDLTTPAKLYLSRFLSQKKDELINTPVGELLEKALNTNTYLGYQQLLTELESISHKRETETIWMKAVVHYYLNRWNTMEEPDNRETQELEDEIVDLRTRLVSTRARVKFYSEQLNDERENYGRMIKQDVEGLKKNYESKVKGLTKQVQKQEERIEELKQEIKELKQQISGERTDSQGLSERLSKTREELIEVTTELKFTKLEKDNVERNHRRSQRKQQEYYDEAMDYRVRFQDTNSRVRKLNLENTELVKEISRLQTLLEGNGISYSSDEEDDESNASSRPNSRQSSNHEEDKPEQSEDENGSSVSEPRGDDLDSRKGEGSEKGDDNEEKIGEEKNEEGENLGEEEKETEDSDNESQSSEQKQQEQEQTNTEEFKARVEFPVNNQ